MTGLGWAVPCRCTMGRVVLPWLRWSAEARCGASLSPGCGAVLCRSALGRVVVPWLPCSEEAHWGVLLRSAEVRWGTPAATPARAQQRGDARFCRQSGHSNEGATTRRGALPQSAYLVSPSEGATARRRTLLHGATSAARAQQHGGVRFYKALR
jgi:hypothetical protein